jgi:hypothetical protein
MVTVPCGRYASIEEAADDWHAAEVRLLAADFHYLHDIKAGTWRVVPAEPGRPARAERTRVVGTQTM